MHGQNITNWDQTDDTFELEYLPLTHQKMRDLDTRTYLPILAASNNGVIPTKFRLSIGKLTTRK